MPYEQSLIVVGHTNPDTDSVCSAIAYAHFKQQVMGMPAVAYRAGNLNPQTQFVLSHFGMPQPELLTSLRPPLSRIMIQGSDLVTLKEQDPVGPALDAIVQRRFAFLPVVDDSGKYAGKISALRLAGLIHDLAQLAGRKRIVLHGEQLARGIGGDLRAGEIPALFEGRLWLEGLGPAPVPTGEPLLAVLNASSEEKIAELVDSGPAWVVVCGEAAVPPAVAARAAGRGIVLMATTGDILSTAVQICLAMPIRDFVERQHPTFKPYDQIRQVQKEIANYNEGGFIVVDDQDYTRGVITRLSFLDHSRFRVALVDHNEMAQAVDGIEEAVVEEVIDHHRLGNRNTDSPIMFINKVVGSTATIISELYRHANSVPPSGIAGLLLSAILSDTVILKSPTTTPLDRDMAQWLAQLAGVGIEAYGEKMFAAGCALDGVTPRQIIQQDLKVYQEGTWKFSVSQMEMVGFDAFHRIRTALRQELNSARERSQCHFSVLMVTDITRDTSLLLCTGEAKVLNAITYPKVAESLFEMKGVLSRKKQMMPFLLDLLRRL